ncbi:conserved hypothetical protein [Anaeromyxobacter sp. Fw109-5]|nr:conserved hypothetical protein [Anaeromyxobacter sp. Fw109-5]
MNPARVEAPRPARAPATMGRGVRAAGGASLAFDVAARCGGGVRIWFAAIAAACLACEPWRCDFHVRDACVEFETDPPDLAEAERRVSALLDRELPFWGLSNLDGWRIQFRNDAEYACYLAAHNDGCTDYLEKTLSVRVPPDADGCFEASELLHELGHYKLGDPMHSNSRWKDVDAQFAPMVWDRPDAAPSCVERYHGIEHGMWPVRIDHF